MIHSQHYNLALTRAVLTAERIDGHGILAGAAAELAFQSLWGSAQESRAEARLEEAANLFRASGLGVLSFESVTAEGGEVRVMESHFATGWTAKYGRFRHPVCAVAAGYIAGALAAVFAHPFAVVETACAAQGKGECRFHVTREPGELTYAAEPSLGAGELISLPAPVPPAFDEAAVIAALLDGPTSGGSPDGIQALGTSVTRLWADYYNQVSYRFERELPRAMGSKFANLPSLVLTEAGHNCAFQVFGGLMRSAAWRERVLPLLQSREDWLHAAVAVINTLGWGTWRVHSLVPGERATIRIYDGYEAVGYRRLFGRAEVGKCYLARATAAALMNLLYVGDITRAPELTPSYYNQLFRSPLSFRAAEARCRAMDDSCCELIANPLSPGLAMRMLVGR